MPEMPSHIPKPLRPMLNRSHALSMSPPLWTSSRCSSPRPLASKMERPKLSYP